MDTQDTYQKRFKNALIERDYHLNIMYHQLRCADIPELKYNPAMLFATLIDAAWKVYGVAGRITLTKYEASEMLFLYYTGRVPKGFEEETRFMDMTYVADEDCFEYLARSANWLYIPLIDESMYTVIQD